MKLKRETVCASLVSPTTPWCEFTSNITASEDWPNQAVYMHEVIEALESPTTCLNTSYAIDTVSWLNTSQANASINGGFMNTYVVLFLVLEKVVHH